jgi:Gliding motility associated protein GldN
MKKIGIFAGFLILAAIITLSCKNNSSTENDNLNFETVADTITYDVIIKNTEKIDPMTDEFLRYLNKTKLIDGIFTSIYSGKLEAYNYFSGKKITVDELKEIENSESYSREDIGKIQFAETWFYSADNSVFKKKVVSMTLGLEQFNDDGTLRGYIPLFKVIMK